MQQTDPQESYAPKLADNPCYVETIKNDMPKKEPMYEVPSLPKEESPYETALPPKEESAYVIDSLNDIPTP